MTSAHLKAATKLKCAYHLVQPLTKSPAERPWPISSKAHPPGVGTPTLPNKAPEPCNDVRNSCVIVYNVCPWSCIGMQMQNKMKFYLLLHNAKITGCGNSSITVDSQHYSDDQLNNSIPALNGNDWHLHLYLRIAGDK